MKHTPHSSPSSGSTAGFSMVELLTVVGIMLVLLAVSGPRILNYLRTYQIRGAVQNLTGDLQAARNRAIAKNVNLGVAVVVQNNNTYWTHLEDDQSLPRTTGRQPLDLAAPDPVQSVRRQLPQNIEFATTAAQCPTVAGFAPTDSGVRFNRLGAACDPVLGNLLCPNVTISGGAATNAIHTTAAGSTLCLMDRRTGLTRNITVTPGGRVRFQQ